MDASVLNHDILMQLYRGTTAGAHIGEVNTTIGAFYDEYIQHPHLYDDKGKRLEKTASIAAIAAEMKTINGVKQYHRKDANIAGKWWLCFDIEQTSDKKTLSKYPDAQPLKTTEDAKGVICPTLDAMGVFYMWHTSYSHNPTAQNARIRVFVFSRVLLDPKDAKRATKRIIEAVDPRTRELYLDESSADVSRIMFLPNYPDDRADFYQCGMSEGGQLFDMDMLQKLEPAAAAAGNTAQATEAHQGDAVDLNNPHDVKQLGDPRQSADAYKAAFCTLYDIHQTIDIFMPDIYSHTDDPHRYTLIGASGDKGLAIYTHYSMDLYACSNHSTDPAHGQGALSAWDLLRVHRGGAAASYEKSSTNLKKWIESNHHIEWEAIRHKVLELQGITAAADAPLLQTDDDGKTIKTLTNLEYILTYYLDGLVIEYDEFQKVIKIDNVPDDNNGRHIYDRDIDMHPIRKAIESRFHFKYTEREVDSCIATIAERNKYNPMQRYLDGLEWDGVPRIDTYFIDFLDAEDDDDGYTRLVTRIMFMGLINRAINAPCKHDYVPLLLGDQGIGKSTCTKKLCFLLDDLTEDDLHTDSIENFNAKDGKDAAEKIVGAQVVELGELTTFKKTDVETIKQFITKTQDKFRASGAHGYARKHPRYNIFIGTSNGCMVLRDSTGNRRFHPIQCATDASILDDKRARGEVKQLHELTEDYQKQLHAEAYTRFKAGELSYPTPAEKRIIEAHQEEFTENNSDLDDLIAYAEMEIPVSFSSWSLTERIHYYHPEQPLIYSYGETPSRNAAAAITDDSMMQRQHITIREFLAEYRGMAPAEQKQERNKYIPNRLEELLATNRRFERVHLQQKPKDLRIRLDKKVYNHEKINNIYKLKP